MSVGKFLRRWSRLKRQRRPALPVETKALELPSLDGPEFQSEFRAFLQAGVAQSVQRAALKRLFSDPSFNATDPLDVYIDDYSPADSIKAIVVDETVRADSSAAAEPEQPPANAEEPEEPPPAPRPGEPPR